MLICWLGTVFIQRVLSCPGCPQYQKIETSYWLYRIAPLSILFCINIVLGNLSLKYIHVSFMQTIKSSVPACTVLFQILFLSEKIPKRILLSIIPIVGGVMLATYTEINFDPIGFWCAVIASFITAGMAILTSILLYQSLNPLSLLYYMAPISLGLLLPFCYYFEFSGIVEWSKTVVGIGSYTLLVVSGLIAFLLNISQFFIIQKTSALTFTVAGNFKVILSVTFSVMIFKNEITILNGFGCSAALAGVAWYNQLRYNINKENKKPILPITKDSNK